MEIAIRAQWPDIVQPRSRTLEVGFSPGQCVWGLPLEGAGGRARGDCSPG